MAKRFKVDEIMELIPELRRSIDPEEAPKLCVESRREAFAKFLRQNRDRSTRARGIEGLSQKEFAVFIGVHYSTVRHWEQGVTKIQDIDLIFDLTDLLTAKGFKPKAA